MQIANAVYDPGVQAVGNWTRLSDADLRAAGFALVPPCAEMTSKAGFLQFPRLARPM
jgi:hypothetical protein